MAKGGSRFVLGFPSALPDPPPCACSLVAHPLRLSWSFLGFVRPPFLGVGSLGRPFGAASFCSRHPPVPPLCLVSVERFGGAAPLPLVRCSGVGSSAALGAPSPFAPAPLFHSYMHEIATCICTMLCGVYVCKPLRLRFAWRRSAPFGRPCRKVVRQWVYAHCYPKKRLGEHLRLEKVSLRGCAAPPPLRRAARSLALALATSLVRSLLRSLSCARLRFAWLRALGSLGSLPLSFLAVRSARLGVGGLPLG